MMKTYQLMPVDKWREPEPDAEGISIRFSYRTIDDVLPRYVQWCEEHDKPFMLHPMAGKHSYRGWGEWISVEGRKHQEATDVPLPWSVGNLDAVHDLIQETGERIDGNTLFTAWHMPGFRDSSELHIPPEFKRFDNWENMLCCVILRRLGLMQFWSRPGLPVIVDYSYIREIHPWLLQTLKIMGVGLQHNGLKATSNRAWITHATVTEHEPHGFQAVGGIGRAGDPEEMFRVAERSGAQWLELYPGQVRAWARRKSNA